MRECHGDLHLANVVLLDGALVAFDCIEFDPALRWIDVMSDIAFLSMDLKAHGRGDLAFRFLDAWLQRSGDYPGLAAPRYYEVCRAMVRAMAVRMSPPAQGSAALRLYLACGAALTRPPEGGARLTITHGFSGSGESSLALKLLCAAGAVRLRSDVERERLHGLDPQARSSGLGLDLYGEQATRLTHARLLACARSALLAGYPVIVDAAFLRAAEQSCFQNLAAELRLPFSILRASASVATLRRRVAERGAAAMDASETWLSVLEHQLERHEVLDSRECASSIDVWTEGAIDISAIVERWRAAT